MKELTIEEKAKCYDETIERAKKIHKYSSDLAEIKRIEQIFPELKESEDERISKEIIDIIDSYDVAHLRAAGLPSRIPKYIAWLEKQGEQKPIELNEKYIAKVFEEVGLSKVVRELSNDELTNALQSAMIELAKKQREQKPAWSKKDANYTNSLIEYLNDINFHNDSRTINGHKIEFVISWLKSLKERYTWRPSEEQIKALEHFVRSVGESGYASPYDNNTKLLYSLLEQLKKLKG